MTSNEHYEHAEERQKKSDKDKAEFQFGYPPKNQDKPPQIYSKIRTPNEYYPYRNIKGELEFGIFRDNTKAVKTVRPWAYSHALKAWHSKFPTNFEGNKKYKRTLYKAEVLGETIKQEKKTSVPDERLTEIIICEGEKTVNAAEEIFRDPVIMSWSGGAKSTHRTDWSIIKDRKVYLWPDNDKEGFEAMLKIGKYLEKDNEVYWANIPDNFPLKWDLADEVPKSFDKELITLLEEATIFTKAKATVDPKKFDILQPMNFVWIEEPKRLVHLDEPDKMRDKEQVNALYRKHHKNALNYLQEKGVQTVWSTAYYPKRGMLFEEKGTKYLNAYRNPDIHGKKGDITHWLKELDRFFGKDDEDKHYYNQRVAHLIQKPEIKIPWCHHKGGVQGNGKSAKDTVVLKIAGEYNGKVIRNDELLQSFNGYMENNLAIFVEEIMVEGKKRAGLMNSLKVPISSSMHSINKKNVNQFTHYCPTAWFSNSNSVSPFYLERGDRRFYCYWSYAARWEEDYGKFLIDPKTGWFNQLENLEAIRYYYEQYSLKDFVISYPRMTPYKEQLVEHGDRELHKYLDECWDKDYDCFQNKQDLISARDIATRLKAKESLQKNKVYVSDTEVFNWAIARGGKALSRKSIRCKDGKKRNLVAMRNYPQWERASEGEIKEYYTPVYPYDYMGKTDDSRNPPWAKPKPRETLDL